MPELPDLNVYSKISGKYLRVKRLRRQRYINVEIIWVAFDI